MKDSKLKSPKGYRAKEAVWSGSPLPATGRGVLFVPRTSSYRVKSSEMFVACSQAVVSAKSRCLSLSLSIRLLEEK